MDIDDKKQTEKPHGIGPLSMVPPTKAENSSFGTQEDGKARHSGEKNKENEDQESHTIFSSAQKKGTFFSFSQEGLSNQPSKPLWRKKYPVLFWLGCIFCFLIIVNILSRFLSDKFSGPKIAVVNIEGMIVGSRDVTAWIEKIRGDSEIEGVLLRVDSPGGGVGASQEIYYAVSRLAKTKPVVVSMGTVAASGGYYVSLPAKRIFAVPSTLTGSIGVKMSLTNVEALMKVLGISSTTLATGNLKDAGTPFREMTGEERAYLQDLIGDMFNDFVGVVSKHRKLSKEQVLAVADGRGITGRKALEYKLIDELGDMQDALSYLKEECGIDPETKVNLIEGPVEEGGFIRKIISSAIQDTIGQAKERQAFFY